MTLFTRANKKTMPDLAEFMTTEEAAEKLGFHVQSIRNMIRTNKLAGLKIGGKTWLVSKRSVQEYLKETSGMSKNDPRRKLPN
ncbi:MAG: helix-turn-helix domain-containing protein [Anaerolineales bacterium]|jgi:excisionase family DNA binding protein